jgi:hypothetical protein
MNTVRIVVLTVAMSPGGTAAGLHSIALNQQLSQTSPSSTAGDRSPKENNRQNEPVARSAKLELEPERHGTLTGQATKYGSGVIVSAYGIALQTEAQK